MAIKIGRGSGLIGSADSLNNPYAITLTDTAGNTFKPTAGQYLCIVYGSGTASATDVVSGASTALSIGWGTANNSVQSIGASETDGASVGTGNYRGIYTDAIISIMSSAGASRIGALNIHADQSPISDGIRLILSVAPSVDYRFQVLVIEGLSAVALATINAPVATGSTAHAWTGFADPDLLLFLAAGGSLTAANTAGTVSAMTLGVAKGITPYAQWVTAMADRLNFTNPNRAHYGLDGECVVVFLAANFLLGHANLTAVDASNITLNWTKNDVPQSLVLVAAIKGIDAVVANGLTRTDTNDIDVGGLSGTCLGGIVASCGHGEDTPGTQTAQARLSIGTFNGNSQAVHAINSTNVANPTQADVGVEYDNVYLNIAADALVGTMEARPVGEWPANSARFRMTDTDPSAAWFGTVLFADPAAGAPAYEQSVYRFRNDDGIL